jgi:hypothetical protein
MKKLLILIALIANISVGFCQKDSTLIDSLHFSNVCFDGLCLGESILKMKKKLGKPSKVNYFNGIGDLSDEIIPNNSFFYSSVIKNQELNIIIVEMLIENLKGRIFNFFRNMSLNLDNVLKINGTIKDAQKKIPNSYKRAIKEKDINKAGTGRLYMKIYGSPEGFESVNSIIIELEKGIIKAIYTQDENSI